MICAAAKPSHVHVPNDHLSLVATRGGESAVRAERDASYPADLPRKRARQFPGGGVVELHGRIVARGREEPARRVERNVGEVPAGVVLDVTDRTARREWNTLMELGPRSRASGRRATRTRRAGL